jgi:hypothetical protein
LLQRRVPCEPKFRRRIPASEVGDELRVTSHALEQLAEEGIYAAVLRSGCRGACYIIPQFSGPKSIC